MNAVLDKLPALVTEELETANNIHRSFHSPHEGWAVLNEEVEEAHAELIDMECFMRELWAQVKNDEEVEAQSYARRIEWTAVRLAAEAIQVAAMARKFQAIEPGAWT